MTIRRILFILLLVQSILLSAQNLWKKRYFQDGFGDNTSQPFLCANYPGKSNSLDVYLSMRVYDSERYGLFLEMRIAEELYGPEMISNPIQVSAKFKGQVYNLPVYDVTDNITIILEAGAQKKLIDLLSSNSYDDLKVSVKYGDIYRRNCIFNINCPTGLNAELKKSGIIKPSTTTPHSSSNSSYSKSSASSGNSTITKFLNDIFIPEKLKIYSDAWIYKHCTTKMQKKLRDMYVSYEDEDEIGWASNYIAGWRDGEDIATEVTSIFFSNGYYYVYLEAAGMSAEYLTGNRVLKYKVSLVNGVPVIDDCEWIQDFNYE